MGHLNRLVLVINSCYEPIRITDAKRAMILLAKGAAVEEAASGYFIQTPRLAFPLPSVIRLVRYRRVPRMKRTASRKNIMLRDDHRCAYCSKQFTPKELTLDHVIPRSRGGGNAWENLVASCYKCNNLKGDRTPDEAGMKLAKQPRPIGVHAKHRMLAGNNNPQWNKFLFV